MPPLSAPLAWLPTWLPGWPAPAPASPAEAAEPLAERLAALEDRIVPLEAHSSHAAGARPEDKHAGTLGTLERRVSGLEKDSVE